MGWLDGVDAFWVWLTLGLVLAGLEMLVPGVYLIWLGIAAIITGLLTMALHPSLPVQVVEFVALALIAAFSARRMLRDKGIASPDPLLNRRGARLVGEIATVTHAIEAGSGRVHLGDSDWIARGPDVPVGERVRVTGSEGAVLLVEPAKLLKGDGS
jgi:membrane protein implicated in regulation of membrane protease activity